MSEVYMKNTIKKIVMSALAVMLTGCMKVTVTYDVSKDAEVKSSMKFLIGESYLTMGGSTPEEGAESLMESYKESNPDAVLSAVSEEFEDETYYGFIDTNAKPECTAVKENNTITFTIPRTAVNDMGMEDTEEINEELKETGLSALLVINMPANAESNFGTVNGKTVTIDVLELPSDAEDIVVTCKLPNLLIPIICAAAAVLLVLFFVMKGKGKKGPESPAAAPVAAEQTVPASENNVYTAVSHEPAEPAIDAPETEPDNTDTEEG